MDNPGHDEQENFISLKIEGSRFDQHAVPVDLLQDLSSLQDALVELARDEYFADNAGRSRIPKNFKEAISIPLTRIDQGSACPKLEYAKPDENLEAFLYAERAKKRLLDAIKDTSEGNITHSSKNLLRHHFLIHCTQKVLWMTDCTQKGLRYLNN